MPRLQAGKHHVHVISASFTESTKGTMGIKFEFENDDGQIDCTRWVTPNTVDRVTKDLETLGYASVLFEDASNLDRIQEITLGNECEIVVDDEEYNGNWTPKVKWINSPSKNGSASVGMRDKLHMLLTRKPVPAGLVSGPIGTQPTPPLTDDDLPF